MPPPLNSTTSQDLQSPKLPTEILLQIFGHFVPEEPSATFKSTESGPILSPVFVEGRLTLRNACLASRQLLSLCRPYLYSKVAIRNCRELLCFFRTLFTTPPLCDLVTSFAWLAALAESDDLDVDAPEFRGLASLVADCYESVPRPLPGSDDALIGTAVGLDGVDTFRAWNVLGMVLFKLGTLRFLFLGLNLRRDALPTWLPDTMEGTIIANGNPAVPPRRRRTYSYEAQCLEIVSDAIKEWVERHSETSENGPSLLPNLEMLMIEAHPSLLGLLHGGKASSFSERLRLFAIDYGISRLRAHLIPVP